MVKIIDLFSGAGGFSLGYTQAGFKISQAIEFDANIAQTYLLNHKETELLITDIREVKLLELDKDAEVVIGGPPCQGFSMAGARNRIGFIDDPRNYLFKNYIEIVKYIKPKVFIMENVKGLLTMHNGSIYEEITKALTNKIIMNGSSYRLFTKVVNTEDFGIPQKRERVLIIGIRTKSEFSLEDLWNRNIKNITISNPSFFNRTTVEDAISNLTNCEAIGTIETPISKTYYQRYLSSKDSKLKNHIKTNHSEIAVQRMKNIFPGENYMSLDEKINSVHSGSYGRLRWDDLAPTITTRFDTPAGGRFIHPVLNRTLTPREAARIQSFPDSFEFLGPKSSITTQIGNAVPPKLAYFLAELTKIIMKEVEFNE